MNIPSSTLKDMFTAGCHFGHTARRWNPKMAPYIYGVRNYIHIINLDLSLPLFNNAIKAVYDVSASGGRVLFVGTKRQAQDIIADTAKKTGQYYINHRWLGGTMTNWNTITASVKKLKELDALLEKDTQGLTKKELLGLQRKQNKLQLSLGGIRDMAGLPDLLVVIDTAHEKIAIQEAKLLNIPIVGIVDTNADPDSIDYPVPGNDDAGRAIQLYCDMFANAILSGLEQSLAMSGADLGSRDVAPMQQEQQQEAEEVASQENVGDAHAPEAVASDSHSDNQ